ncbi:mitotic-spindle organizing protein 2B isoform 2-T2 [Anomaloglossus baeobatrachus]|uniref:mitotic-spindle organizing protein 2B isoform X2 n=1 Tax=Anomaloglossus baeobatrachus TaxID=238106 RepID=UPI003F505134
MAAAPPGPDAAMTVSGSVQKYVTKKKKALTAEEAELFELVQASGVVMDQEVFRIIVDLLKMNVAPLAIFQMLKSMCAGHRLTEPAAEAHSSPGLLAHSDTRELQFLTAKNSKIPAPLSSFSSYLRAPRMKGSKIVVYSSVDACSPISQGRNKLNPPVTSSQGPADRSSREGSSQRMPRQSSASRMQKSSSSGKSSGGSST